MKLLAKTVVAVFVLAVAVAAQSAAPITVAFSTMEAQATNVTSKQIVMVAVTVSSKELPDTTTIHDFYFVQGGMAAGDVKEVVHGDSTRTITAVKPLFVQFEDGSFWGDTSLLADPNSPASYVVSKRKPLLAMFQGAVQAAQNGDQSLTDYLSNVQDEKTRGFAKRLLSVQKQSGTAAAVQQAQTRVNAAKNRSF